MKADLHVHTCFSPDSLAQPEIVIRAARRAGLDAIAVTDHNTLAGARAIESLGGIQVIVGEEVMTSRGEIIGLFLQECIAPGMAPVQSAEAIHAQGGLVCVPHPFDRYRGSAIAEEALGDLAPLVDLVEVLNARVLSPADNARATAWAVEKGLPMAAGSDAHHPSEIGRAHVQMQTFGNAIEFLLALQGASIRGSTASPLVHLHSVWARLWKRVQPGRVTASTDGRGHTP